MALKRAFLSAMGIESDKINEIINAHMDTVNALQEERDSYKEKAELYDAEKKKSEDLQKKIDELEKERSDEESYKSKYESTKKEYEDYKKGVDAENTKRDKTAAYKKLLKEVGISDKRIDTVIKCSDSAIEALKIDKDGNIEDVDKVKESIKKEWEDFRVTEGQKGAETQKPPAGNGNNDTGEHYAAKRVAETRANMYGVIKSKEE